MSGEALTLFEAAETQDVPPGYKQTEVGFIPADWVVTSLGELGEFKNGINKGKEDFGHGFPLVNLLDVFGVAQVSSNDSFGLVNSSDVERDLYSLREGDTLFVRSSVKPSGVGLTTLVKNDLQGTVFSGFLIRFRDNEHLDSNFKRYCFHERGFRTRLIASSTVSANTNVNQNTLKSLQLAFPPGKREQRAIAAALSDVDDLISSLDGLISKKLALKTAAMQQLLTGKLRLRGFSGEWETRRLETLGRFSKGKGIKRDDVTSEGYPCIRYGEIYTLHHDYVRRFYSYIPLDVAQNSQKIKKNDLLFTASGETREEIGKCVAYLNDQEAYAGGDIVIFSPEIGDAKFLGYLMNDHSIAAQKSNLGQGDAVVHIGAKGLAQLRLFLPSVAEQSAIATVLSDMDAEIEALEARQEKTRRIKQGMLQELLTGRTRLVPVGT